MVYLLKGDIILRSRTDPPSELEVFIAASQRWKYYPFWVKDLGFVQNLTADEAADELVNYWKLSRTDAQKAVRS